MKITIGNKNKGHRGEYVGRPSPLGNPFTLSARRSRDEAIALYRGWLGDKVRQGDPAVCGELDRLYELASLGSVCLVCWCHPLPCHAEVIRETLAGRGWSGWSAARQCPESFRLTPRSVDRVVAKRLC